MSLIEGLNPEQKEAVLETEGAVLVIAGAGSGKTKVLTHKIAYLIQEKDVAPWNILAITFTNKAASEMKVRIENLVSAGVSKDIWIGTFHAICLRILRKHIEKVGYLPSFTIYDVQEQKAVIKQIIKNLGIESKVITDKYVQNRISGAKNRMITPEKFQIEYSDYYAKTVSEIYTAYQKRLKENNSIDFDDIINFAIQILEENQEVRDEYARKFRYILVDEYQDTNTSQFKLVKMLTEYHGNITVVGDNDQGIYSFRGADISNILDFEKDYEKALVVKLEQNYRSTGNILQTANDIISNNESKYDKKLWTENGSGDKVEISEHYNEYDEARYVVQKIKEELEKVGSFNDFAILYRVNALSRVFEEQLLREGIPYKIIGGFKFYERKEIKDVIAYLRLLINPYDNISFARVINEPKRGIGQTSIDKITDISFETGQTMIEVCKHATEYGLGRIYLKSKTFVDVIEKWTALKTEMKIAEVAFGILEDSGYLGVLQEESKTDEKAYDRLQNVLELINVISEYETQEAEATLEGFIENVSLSSDSDELAEEEKVTLMTVHTAKGLEYPVVFVVGMEEGIFPSARSIDEEGGIEEERRLCYVSVTRAKQKLYITFSAQRSMYGRSQRAMNSRFIDEISDQGAEKKITKSYGNMNEDKWNKYDDFSLGYSSGSKYDYTNTGIKAKASSLDFGLSADKFLESLKSKQTEKEHDSVEIGDRVEHKKWGKGNVMNIIISDPDRIIDVQFDEGKRIKLIEAYAGLTKI